MKHFPAIKKALLAAMCVLTALPVAAEIKQRPAGILRSPEAPMGNINALVTRAENMMDYNESFWGTLNISAGRATKLFNSYELANGEEYDMQSGVVRDGILYIPQFYYDELGMITLEGTVRWKRFDISTGRRLDDIYYGTSADGNLMYLYSMTYDSENDCIYGLSWNNTQEVGGTLVKIDCKGPEASWNAVRLGDLGGSAGNWMANVCYNPANQKLYGLKDDGAFYEIDITGSEPRAIKVMQYDDFDEHFCYVAPYYTIAMCYSPYDHAFLFEYISTGGDQMALASIDAETFDAYKIADLNPQAYIAVLHSADSYADDKAPNRMAAPALNFVDASLTGTISVQLPTTLFDGTNLNGNVTLHLYIDDKEVKTAEVAAGSIFTEALTLEQGYHKISVAASVGDLMGPKSTTYIYTGHDHPYAPTELNLENGVLSWKKPVDTGVNQGYLDLSNVTYDVYLNGEKYNDAPISETSIPFSVNEQLNKRSSITVVATANGVSSEPSTALTRVLGTGYTLPVTWLPSLLDIDLFEMYNINNDNFTFEYVDRLEAFRIYTTDYTCSPDDWLITPPVNFEDSNSLYNLVVDYAQATQQNTFYDDLDIYIGKEPIPSAMTRLIYSHEGREQGEIVEIPVRFNIDEAGTYYIGFHSKNPNKKSRYRGILLKNFRINKDESTSAAPADPTDIVVAPAPNGDLFYNISATLPTKSINGNDIPADTDVTLTAKTDCDEKSVTGKPGEKVTLKVDVPEDGWSALYLSPSSSEGTGVIRFYNYYVGFDTPLAPVNLKGLVTEDNLGIDLTWDAVGEVGYNGGYVDPADVTYDMYLHTSTSSTFNSTKVGTAGHQTSYSFRVGDGVQQRYNISPVAVNQSGTSVNGTVFTETLGRPYQIPFMEEWGYASFNYTGWRYNTVAPFDGVEWSHAQSLVDYPSNMGPTTMGENGSFMAVGTGSGELICQKISTKGIEHVMTRIRYWDFPYAGKMEIWARSFADQEFKKAAELTPARGQGSWEEWEAFLPAEYADQPWCQFNVRVELENGQAVLLDNYNILQHTANDFRVSDIQVKSDVIVGSNQVVNVVVTNSGEERNKGNLIVELVADSSVINRVETDIAAITAGSTFEFTAEFPMLEAYTKYEFLEVRAIAASEIDENPSNNEMSVDFNLYDHAIPIVRDLKAQRLDNGQDVKLTWSEPTSQNANLESFETYQAFTIKDQIGPFKNYDLDGLPPFQITGYTWNNGDKPCAWQVFDPKAVNATDIDRLTPHTGDRMLIARQPGFDDTDSTSEVPNALDFLVSPAIVGGSTVDFWLITFDSSMTETVQVWYSTTDDELDPENIVWDEKGIARECGSFKWYQNFSKSGTDLWEHCVSNLPADARYFAIVYASIGQYGVGIDDLKYEAVKPDHIVPEFYDVYLKYNAEDEPQLVAPALTDTEFTHITGNDHAATYYVRSVITDYEEEFSSPLSNPASVSGTGVDNISLDATVAAGKGKVLVAGAEGMLFTIYDLQGRKVLDTVVTSDHEVISCAPGIYVARLGNATYKLIVR